MIISTTSLEESEVQKVLMYLGFEYPYTDYDHLDRFIGSPLPRVSSPRPTEVVARVRSILLRLSAIDTALVSAYSKSYAVGVDNLKLNFGQQIILIRSEGSLLLRELASYYGLSVAKDKYNTTPPKPSSYYY